MSSYWMSSRIGNDVIRFVENELKQGGAFREVITIDVNGPKNMNISVQS